MDVIEELKEKKQKILDLQQEKARQEGQRDQLLQQLEDKFGVSSSVEGKKKLTELNSVVAENKVKIEELNNELDKIISKATFPEEKG